MSGPAPASGPAPSPAELTRRLKQEALRLGFDHCRIAPIGEAPHADFFAAWLDAGRAGAMEFLHALTERRRSPVLHSPVRDGAEPFRSVIVLGAHYSPGAETAAYTSAELAGLEDPARGRVAAYAWGSDYHDLLRLRVYDLDAALRNWSGRTTFGKGLVDTGPVLERDWAARAGLGFFGKNCCVIHPVQGSWLLLATLLAPERFVYDGAPPLQAGEPEAAAVLSGLPPAGDYGTWSIPLHGNMLAPAANAVPDVAAGSAASDAAGNEQPATCGRCTRCLDACPTGAFVGPYHLDPQRCIAYWTIETQAPIPPALRPAFGNRIFGCDICQAVCPWNQRLPAERRVDPALAPQPGHIAPPLLGGFDPADPYWLDEAAFARRFAGTPVLRATRAGMLRNVCVALGNWASARSLPALAEALDDPHPAPRGHAAWALGRLAAQDATLASTAVLPLLQRRLAGEADAWVRNELADACNLAAGRNPPPFVA